MVLFGLSIQIWYKIQINIMTYNELFILIVDLNKNFIHSLFN